MGHLCEYCKEELKKGERFILIGNYPGFMDRVSSRFWFIYEDDLGDYGSIYHESCFFTILKNNKPYRYKKRGG